MGSQYPHKLTVILEPEEDRGYSIHCPALPGCSSQGNSVEEALDNIREAILGVLKVRQKERLPIPRETPRMVTEEIRQILAGRAEDGLPLTIETREVELPAKVAVYCLSCLLSRVGRRFVSLKEQAGRYHAEKEATSS